jgi:uncharacterized lipoprotein YddW (UPF0748 family)
MAYRLVARLALLQSGITAALLCLTTSGVHAQPKPNTRLAVAASLSPSPLAGSIPVPTPAPTPTPTPIVLPTPLVIAAPSPLIAAPTSPELLKSATLLGLNTPLPLDLTGDQIGIAQSQTHQRGLQARIIWIDGTASIDSINTADKISALMLQIKNAGFNTVVFDVKPIVGFTLYPSRYAPKLTTWKSSTLPANFDPLAAMIAAAHVDGLKLIANMAVFSEGHKLMNEGQAYTAHPDWQTQIYEATRTMTSPILGASPIVISDTPNQLASNPLQVAYFSDPTNLHKNFQQPGTAIVTDFMGRVLAQVDASVLGSVKIAAPAEGAVLIGMGGVGDRLRNEYHIGDLIQFNSVARTIPISQAPEQKYTLFVNPNNPDVRQYELNIVQEIATNYNIDGIIFDDRLRFAAINADFSDASKKQFEAYVGQKLNWPNDIFQINPFPGQEIIKGPYYQDWTLWRALSIRNWLADAKAVVKTIRPNATVSAYVGSWYGEYDQYGENWAADDFSGPFAFDTPNFQKTGFAGLLDWMSTGCYYPTATIIDGNSFGEPGASVEAAGQLSNRAANDQTFVYGGLYVQLFNGDTNAFARCLEADAASTQGIMLFDLSMINSYNFWPVITQAFAAPAVAPHDTPGLLDDIRSQHAEQKLMGTPQPPVVNYGGVSGTGL